MEGLNLQPGVGDGEIHGKEAKHAVDQAPHPHSGPSAPYRSPFEALSTVTAEPLGTPTNEPLGALTENVLQRFSSPTKGRHRKALPSNASLGSTLAVMGSGSLPDDAAPGMQHGGAQHSSMPGPSRGSGTLFTPISSRDPHRPQPVPIPPELDSGLHSRAALAASPFQSRSLDEDIRLSKVDQFVDALEAGATPLMGVRAVSSTPSRPHVVSMMSRSSMQENEQVDSPQTAALKRASICGSPAARSIPAREQFSQLLGEQERSPSGTLLPRPTGSAAILARLRYKLLADIQKTSHRHTHPQQP